jgi:quercetin dioxygenase-like cupin family protein
MRKSRVVGLLFLAAAALAQQSQSVEITSEPSHHLVFQNEYVRVFDVTVAPKASTLVHRHNYDYIFVTLGDSDVVSVRPGEKPVSLLLKDGEVRYTPGNFAHAAINNSAQPFHNITIELLKPSANVHTCTEACDVSGGCVGATLARPAACPSTVRRITSDQWQMSLVTLPPSSWLEKHTHATPHLVVAVSDLDLTSQTESASSNIKKQPGGLAWVPSGVTHSLTNNGPKPAQFVTLEFKAEKQ